MTRTFAADANHDLYIEGDRLVILTGLPAVLQLCESASETLLGEMVLAVNEGLPMFSAVWSGRPNIPVYETALRLRLQRVEGVDAVLGLTINPVEDRLTYTATIRTIYGTGTING